MKNEIKQTQIDYITMRSCAAVGAMILGNNELSKKFMSNDFELIFKCRDTAEGNSA